jgi:hypothetical protein
MASTMKLDQLGRYVLIAGGVLVMLSAALLIGGKAMKANYRLENEKALEAIGRELSGTNNRERKRIERLRAGGYWTLGIGIAAMGVGGVFIFYGSRKPD